MYRRLTELPGIMKIIRNTAEYGIRSLDLMLMRTICSVLAILGLAILSTQVLIGVTQADLDKFALDNLASSAAWVTFLISISTFAALFLVIRLYRTIVISQFQSMLFSDALKLNSVMCIIINSNFNILYLDETARSILCKDPETNNKRQHFDLEQLFVQGKIDGYNRKQFMDSIKNNNNFSVQHTIITHKGDLKHVVTRMDPLIRPSKYFLIRSYLAHGQEL